MAVEIGRCPSNLFSALDLKDYFAARFWQKSFSSFRLPKLPRRRRILSRPQSPLCFSGFHLQPFKFFIVTSVSNEPPCEPGLHNFIVQVPAIRQNYFGYLSA